MYPGHGLAFAFFVVAAPAAAPRALSASAASAASVNAPAPDVRLTVAEESKGRWRMRVENTGAVPVRVMADARLLSFDVTPAGAKKALHCILPADMRPDHPDERALVMPPQRAYVEAFDPRLFCFGTVEAAALAPGATVVAHLGWPAPAPRRAATGPFEVEPLALVTPAVAAMKELVSSPWTVAAVAGAGAAGTAAAGGTPLDDNPPLAVSSQEHDDAARASEVVVTVTVTNRTSAPITTLVRPETLAFDVVAPDGTLHGCDGARAVDSPIRELYETIPPRRHASVSVLLSQVCPARALELAGVYSVTATLDTRRASGRSVGLTTFDGFVAATAGKPTRVRIRKTRSSPPAPRATLE